MSLGDVAADFGKGQFAGVAGTAAMTVYSPLQMKLSGRPASQTPAGAAETVLDVQPEDEDSEARFSNLVHWGYGTCWGGVRGLLARPGFPAPLLPWPTSGWCGGGAGSVAGAQRLGSRLQVRRKGDRHGPRLPRPQPDTLRQQPL